VDLGQISVSFGGLSQDFEMSMERATGCFDADPITLASSGAAPASSRALLANGNENNEIVYETFEGT
jgi:hypothetical protein